MKIILYCSPFFNQAQVNNFELEYLLDNTACARLVFPEFTMGAQKTRDEIDHLVSDLKAGYIDTLYIVTRYETAPGHVNGLAVDGVIDRKNYEIRRCQDEFSNKYTVHHIEENDMIGGNWPYGILF